MTSLVGLLNHFNGGTDQHQPLHRLFSQYQPLYRFLSQKYILWVSFGAPYVTIIDTAALFVQPLYLQLWLMGLLNSGTTQYQLPTIVSSILTTIVFFVTDLRRP